METLHPPGGIVIVGAGIAGLWTALQLAPRDVLVLTAGKLGSGSSSWAQGGIAAPVGPDDSAELHRLDTIAAGAGLTEEDAARILTDEGAPALHALADIGVPFDRDGDGAFLLGREAAHNRSRIAHVGGDEAGAAIMRVLAEKAAATASITIKEGTVAERVVTGDDGASGILAWDAGAQRSVFIRAATVVLATGGSGGLYAVTTNPLYSQGHGPAMAAEAGAVLRDMEFVQFHPTALDVGRDPAPLATEAIRGAGATLIGANGERFMPALHRDAELAPRDVVARGVAAALRKGGAWLDPRESIGEAFGRAFPTVDEAARAAGLDPTKEPLPVAPAAHYHMGGILTDQRGRSTVEGLFAVGECASSGVHGANRLASNSLLEAVVFGSRTAEAIKGTDRATRNGIGTPPVTSGSHAPPSDLEFLRRAMSQGAGILRDRARLDSLHDDLDRFVPPSEGARLAHLTASAIAVAAMAREESRGAHFRTDHPQSSEPPRHSLLTWEDGRWHVAFEETGP